MKNYKKIILNLSLILTTSNLFGSAPLFECDKQCSDKNPTTENYDWDPAANFDPFLTDELPDLFTTEKTTTQDFADSSNPNPPQTDPSQSAEKTTEDKKPYVCDYPECSYATGDSTNFARHQRMHTDEKPFVCNFDKCNFRTTRQDTLKIHRRRHTGEMPFACNFDECNYQAKNAANLKAHCKKHTGEKQFVCDFDKCHYQTIRKANLIRHRKKHAGAKSFVCDINKEARAATVTCHLQAYKKILTNEKSYTSKRKIDENPDNNYEDEKAPKKPRTHR